MAETLMPAASALPAGALPPGCGGADPPGVQIAETVPGSATSVAVRRDGLPALRDGAATLGLDLPEQPRWRDSGGMRAIWTGPGRWLVLGGPADGGRLHAALGGVASVADQTDARAVLTVSGPRARDVLARGIALDLHASAFDVGHAAATQAARIPVLLWRVDEDRFALAFARSYAGSLAHWLLGAAALWGYRVD